MHFPAVKMKDQLQVYQCHLIYKFSLLQIPAVVDPDGMNGFDLLTANEHVHDSEVSHLT
jgi:hypothetical protein